jgi:hypothetical protein
MKMPKAMRMLSYVADYEFPEDNILTSMYQEEQRVRHAERIRQVEPVYKLEELSLGTEEHLNNAKKAQNEKGQ